MDVTLAVRKLSEILRSSVNISAPAAPKEVYSDFTCLWMSLSSFSEAFRDTPRHLIWSENLYTVRRLHHSEKHSMEQVIDTFLDKKEHQLFCCN